MSQGFYPKALNRNIAPGSNDPAITPRVAILHVRDGLGDSLHDFFNGPSGGIESHFYIRFDGTVEQYRSIFFQADANLDANDFAVSIETEGLAAGEWTDDQLAAIKRLLRWLNRVADIPLVKIQRWDGSGVGYHTQFGSPSHWTPVAKSCPGLERKVQFETVLVPWMAEIGKPKATIRLATFNVWVGQRGLKLRRNLRRMFKDAGFPHVIVLQEAHGLKRGFWRYKRHAVSTMVRKEADNCVVLVRRDVQFLRRLTLPIKSADWIGPKPEHENPKTHPARIFVGAAVVVDGQAWDILGLHRATSSKGQNRKVRIAEAEQLKGWVGNKQFLHPNRPIVLVGDWNGRPLGLAQELDAQIAMHGIDGALTIGAQCLSVTKLDGKYGSDNHHPVVIDLKEN